MASLVLIKILNQVQDDTSHMDYEMFWLPLLTSFAISALLLSLLLFFEKKLSFCDKRKSNRHSHCLGISRFGGVAIIASFVLTALIDKNLVIEKPLTGVLIASLAILIFGVVDDIRQLSWKTQLFFQIFIVVFIYLMGVKLNYVTNPLGGIVLLDSSFLQGIAMFFSAVWIIFLMNAINWIDGVDGASSGIFLIGVVTIFFLSLRPEVNQPPIAIVCMILAGAASAFLFFNFHPAKILAGTSGSMFMGFVLGVSAIFAGAKIATTLLVMAIPIIDAFRVIFDRIRKGDSIFLPARKHLHFKFLDLNWSVKKICFFYYTLSVIISLVALNTRIVGKTIALVAILVVMLGVYSYIKKQPKKIKD